MNIVLGVSGSVAAYRAADLARELMRQGHRVRVCLTDGATQFVTPALFEALTGQPCLSSVFEEPIPGRMAHIDWAREADAIVIAPATANILGKLASGIADDMLTTLALASTAPWIIAPAMNPHMFRSDAVTDALTVLTSRAAIIVEPVEGEVACGEQGEGKLASVDRIAGAVRVVARRRGMLAGQTVLITSGPTREPIDAVRFVSNRSSGKMGAALARAALLMGANVTVVSGPTATPYPIDADVVRVETATEMLNQALPIAREANLIIGAAAVADYRPASPSEGKLRRTEPRMELDLVANPDIIAELSKAAGTGVKVVGFAAETGHDLEAAREKLTRKNLYAICVNDVTAPDRGFDSGTNELTLLLQDGRSFQSGLMSKLECALWLLEHLFMP